MALEEVVAVDNGKVLGASIGGSGGGGLTQEEHDWLESLAKYTPNMYDVNPTKSQDYALNVYVPNGTYNDSKRVPIVVCGYDAVSFYKYTASNTYAKFVWVYADGSISDEVNFSASSYPIGWHDFKIPENAIAIKLAGPISNAVSNSYGITYFALFTKDSPYNPLNQS